MSSTPPMNDARVLCSAAQGLVDHALAKAREITEGGAAIDEHQVLTERVVYAATEARAAAELLEFTRTARIQGRGGDELERVCGAAVADLVFRLRTRLEPVLEDLGLDDAVLDQTFPADVRSALRRAGHESVFRAIGRETASQRGRNQMPLDETLDQVRSSVREFADAEVAPHAERIHRNDELVPDELIAKMAELGYFALAVPEEFGGAEMGNLAMILTTEELSRASLAGAGSLITRPEILTKALLQGGTDAQKQTWLPKIASGDLMVGISVTEPDVGSDVASVKCRADKR